MIGHLTDREKEIITGTVLGGSSLIRPPHGKNYYLSMRDMNPMWLMYKMKELDGCFKNDTLIKDNKTYRCNSICAEAFTDLYGKLYNGKNRCVTMDVLDPLHDIGLAIWFLDGGGMTGRGKKNAYLNTTKFGADGTQVVLDYFNSLDLKCNQNQNKKRTRVLFAVESTTKLLKIIAPQFPHFMIEE